MGRGDGPAERRPGPMYDDAMRVLVEDDLGAVLSLVGVDGTATRLNPSLAASTRTVDLLVRTPSGLVHVEFVKDPSPDLDLRMVDYRLRLRRAHRHDPIRQAVLVLRDIAVPRAYTDPVDDDQLVCSWSVVRLGDRDPADLLGSPTTAALAPLARGTTRDRIATLLAAADRIGEVDDPDRRATLFGVAVTMASIVLPSRTIATTLEEDAMPVYVRDTPLGREIFDEGWRDGWQDGRQEGRDEGARAAALELTSLLLRQRFGDHPRTADVAAALADVPAEERLTRIAGAAALDELPPLG